MFNFVDFVLVEPRDCDGLILAVAPKFSHLKGKRVIMKEQIRNHTLEGTVVCSYTLNVESEEDLEEFFLKGLCKHDESWDITWKELPRVIATVKRIDLEWEDVKDERRDDLSTQ